MTEQHRKPPAASARAVLAALAAGPEEEVVTPGPVIEGLGAVSA